MSAAAFPLATVLAKTVDTLGWLLGPELLSSLLATQTRNIFKLGSLIKGIDFLKSNPSNKIEEPRKLERL